MSFNLANKPLAERAALEDEKSRLYDLWQSNLGKAKGDAARLFGERAKRKGKWAEWVRSELDAMSPPEDFAYDKNALPGYRWLQLANNGEVASWVERLDT